MSERSCDIKVEVDDDLVLKEKLEIIEVSEEFIDEKGVHKGGEYSFKNEESDSDFPITKVNAKHLTSSFTEEMPQALDPPMDMVYDVDVKLEEKLRILDVSEQFIDEKKVHERGEYLIKNEGSDSNFSVIKVNADQLTSALYARDMPEVFQLPIKMVYDEVKFEEESGTLDVSEQFINVKEIHKREDYIDKHKNEFEHSQTNIDEENNRGKNAECNDSSRKDDQSVNVNIEEYKCSFCENKFIQKENLKIHVESVHSNIKKHKCHLCEHVTIKERDLQSHIDSIHLNIKKHQCQTCGYLTYHKTSLRRHNDAVHLNIKKHKCHLCEYAAAQKGSLNKHVKSVHLNIKEHNCHLCEHAANDKNHLEEHIKSVHLNIKAYNCHLCDYASNDRNNLRRHINGVHLDSRKHQCHLCEYASREKYRLLAHIKSVHLNIKEYKCDVCEYATSDRKHLKIHLESFHSNIVSKKCHLCKFTSYWKQSIKRHVESIHSIKQHK